MKVYRISQTKYINDLTGAGARLYGGRWNKVGTAVLYTGHTLSLCLLEMIVHFESKMAFKKSYSYVSLDIPEKEIIDIRSEINVDTDRQINDPKLWDITEAYFLEQNALALQIPSFVFPEESNIIINPDHKSFVKIKTIKTEELLLDKRLNLV